MKGLYFVVGVVLVLFMFGSSAQAGYRHYHQQRHYHHQGHQGRVHVAALHPDCNIWFPCEVPSGRAPTLSRQAPGAVPFNWFSWSHEEPVASKRTLTRDAGTKIKGLVAPLAAKIAAITSNCGSKLISGVRHTFIAGTHRISLHSFGEAADVSGNPSCIYTMLQDWPGGYSIDYNRVHHVHISYEPGGREWGTHFVHGGHQRHYTHHHRHRSSMSA